MRRAKMQFASLGRRIVLNHPPWTTNSRSEKYSFFFFPFFAFYLHHRRGFRTVRAFRDTHGKARRAPAGFIVSTPSSVRSIYGAYNTRLANTIEFLIIQSTSRWFTKQNEIHVHIHTRARARVDAIIIGDNKYFWYTPQLTFQSAVSIESSVIRPVFLNLPTFFSFFLKSGQICSERFMSRKKSSFWKCAANQSVLE